MNDSLIPELPDFDDPLAVLAACHERMLGQCQTLEKLVDHIRDKGLDAEARSAIGRVANYFNTSAVHHHQDEEQDLFPLLNRQSLKLAELVHGLREQHKALDAAWKTLQGDLKKAFNLPDDPDFPGHVAEFCRLYREHIETENKELLPMARHILSSRQLEDIGKAMAKRRGIRP